MTFSRLLLLFSVVISLAACGESGVGTDTTEATSTVQKTAKFKGAKFAPSQDIMDREAALEFWSREGSAIVTPGEACKRVYRPGLMTPACQAELDDVVAKSTFTPRECRKGDERKGYNNVLVKPVSCDGIIDTPHASAKYLMVFHETDNTIKAWSGGMVSGSLVKR